MSNRLNEGGNALLQDLLDLAPVLCQQVEKVMSPLAGTRDQLRQRLLDAGMILPVPDLEVPRPATMCAVDGARVTTKMSGADMMVAVATSADGMYVDGQAPCPSDVWAQVAPHSADSDKVVGTAMAALELGVAVSATHHLRLLDGSFFTPVIEFRKGLGVGSADVRNSVTSIIAEKNVPQNLAEVLSYDADRPVLALPKSETATVYRDMFSDLVGEPVSVTDRVLASQVLDAGEILRPRPMTEWANSQIVAHSESNKRTRAIAEALTDAISEFQDAVRQNTAMTCYYKPSGANQVLRFEYRTDTPDDVDTAMTYAALLAKETNTPHMMEPAAQWAVDRKAKEISSGARALRAAMINQLDDRQATEWGRFLAENYRT